MNKFKVKNKQVEQLMYLLYQHRLDIIWWIFFPKNFNIAFRRMENRREDLQSLIGEIFNVRICDYRGWNPSLPMNPFNVTFETEFAGLGRKHHRATKKERKSSVRLFCRRSKFPQANFYMI